ncbi:MAG: hypothetical protein AUI52_05430 [Acidobacteria bacterium 13_1_40CM_2_68_10]|nr:MAG: hypothetical protein AUI52_05430 [Acidobacteria bacterium 13_1_40CM_2_68_10]
MSRWRCTTCGGEYADAGPDGTPFYHTCPLLGPVRIRLAAGAVVAGVDPPPPGAVAVPGAPYPPEARRDENIVVLGNDENGAPVTRIRAEGLGRTLLAG